MWGVYVSSLWVSMQNVGLHQTMQTDRGLTTNNTENHAV